MRRAESVAAECFISSRNCELRVANCQQPAKPSVRTASASAVSSSRPRGNFCRLLSIHNSQFRTSAATASDEAQLPSDLLELVQRELEVLLRVGGGDDRAHAGLVARHGRKRDPLREDPLLE